MGATAAIVGAIAGVASTGNAIVSGAKQSRANTLAGQRQAGQIAAAKTASDALTAQQAADTGVANAAATLTAKRAQAATGFGSTLLTGPNGLAPVSTGSKTLLGT